jgi:hypothetical protein
MWMYLWTLKIKPMFKVIVTLTAAASSMLGQLCDHTKTITKAAPIKKEISQPIIRAVAEPTVNQKKQSS